MLSKEKLKISKRQLKKEEKETDLAWSRLIKEKAAYQCEICGKSTQLNSHHIIPREDRHFRHDLMNGVCLCILHHKFSLQISPHRNSFAFDTWLKKFKPHVVTYLEEQQKKYNEN